MTRRLSTRARGAAMPCGMIVIAAFLLGAVIGWMRAARLGGKRADKLQFALAHGLALGVLGVFVTVLISRMG